MRDASELGGLDKMTYLASVPEGECIVGMAVVDGELFVSTDKHIYVLKDKKHLLDLNVRLEQSE